MNCGYCGREIVAEAAALACQGCGLGPGCRSLRCPRCGYENPAPLDMRGGWQRLRRRLRFRRSPRLPPGSASESGSAAAECVLADLRPGQRGEVVRLSGGTPAQARKLMALGVLPGVTLELRRRRPLIVFRLGFAQFAVDPALAAAIHVRPRSG